MSEQRPPPSRPAQGPIGWLLSLTGRLIGLVIGALVLRLVLELAGLYFWWPQEADRHVFQVMRQEQVELVSALQPHPLGDEIVMLLDNGVTRMLKARHKTNWLLHEHVTVLAYTLMSFMLRLIWLILVLPLFFLFKIIGVVEGLVLRDLRRFGGGYESSYMFYWILRFGYALQYTGVLCHLCLPVNMLHLWLFIMIIMMYILDLVMIFNIKKYI